VSQNVADCDGDIAGHIGIDPAALRRIVTEAAAGNP
jgi:hypothetical protein